MLHDVLPRPFDLVIWDWRMPEMSGLELLQRLRNAGNAVPFIMLTRKASHDAVVEARESGVDGYIAKPFTAKQVQHKVMTVARRVLCAAE